MHLSPRALTAALVMLLLAGCSASAPTTGATSAAAEPTRSSTPPATSGTPSATTPATATASSTAPTAAPTTTQITPGPTSTAPVGEGGKVDGQVDLAISGTTSLKDSVISLAMTGVRLTPRAVAETMLTEAGLKPDDVLQTSTQTLVAIFLDGTNTSSQPISWYPAQSSVIVGAEQLESDPLLTTALSPGDAWQPGAAYTGIAVYQSAATVDTLVSSGSLRLLVNPPMDADLNELTEGGQLEVSISRS